MTRRDHPDARLSAARYRVEGEAPEADEDAPVDRGGPTQEQRHRFVEIQIEQAIRRGDFDDLPGAGKPLRGLGGVRDPDWWMRRKIEREGLTGLGPPALTLRNEDRQLDDRLDALPTEGQVREVLADFNRRVREARRQLLGGPPVVVRPRDEDEQVAAWRQRAERRRADLRRAAEAEREREAAARAAMSWRERRRARRRGASPDA